MRHSFVLSAAVLAFAMLVAGCEEGTGGANGQSDNIIDAPMIEQRVAHKSSVQYGTLDELLENEVECNGQSDQRCVQICHRPPGNPENGKTKVLPIKALKAHLNHGADHHNDHDYLGPCEGDISDDDPVIIIDDSGTGDDDGSTGGETGEDGSSSDGSGDSGGNEEVPDGTNDGYGVDVPTWCEPFYDVDQNCDGYDDEFFAPTF